MILTDREIQVALRHGQIVIQPPPKAEAFSSTSVDLTLGARLQIWRSDAAKGVEQTVCPVADGYRFSDLVRTLSDSVDIPPDGYVIRPGAFVLGWTEEQVKLPITTRVAARVEGKSSLARLGIGIHVTAPTIHAGFEGPIQLEICNHGLLHVRVMCGMPICQLIFEQTLGTPDKGYSGQFFHQAPT